MPPPSPLAIASSSVQRLLKEETTYRTELESQEKRLRKLENDSGEDDGNREFQIKQENQAIKETKAVFEPLRQKVEDAVRSLEQLLSSGDNTELDEKEVETAKGLISKAKASDR
ncbi:MAG: hypothetical protein Q9218_002319 [Villophora microphyllina]